MKTSVSMATILLSTLFLSTGNVRDILVTGGWRLLPANPVVFVPSVLLAGLSGALGVYFLRRLALQLTPVPVKRRQ